MESVFFKFIWSGGNDRVKRKLLYNDYDHCDLKMIDIRSFASVQKLIWSRYLLNGEFDSPWKQIEIINLSEFHSDPEILFRAHATEKILKRLNMQLAETIRVWYAFRSRLLSDSNLVEIHRLDSLWYNKNVCLKTKRLFYYPAWYEMG